MFYIIQRLGTSTPFLHNDIQVHVLLYRIENISMKLMLACFFLPDIVSCKLKTYILTKIYMYVKLDENEHAS